MSYAVDTCVILDVLDDDPEFGGPAVAIIDKYADAGLVVCPVTYIELAPAFYGDRERLEYFLQQLNIDSLAHWTRADSEMAFDAWNRYVKNKRAGRSAKRPVADIQIGAFASCRDGLITRNAKDFNSTFPDLRILIP